MKRIEIAIIIPTLNNYNGLISCINSVVSRIFIPRFFIIDNSKYNQGVSASWNYGMKTAYSHNINIYLILNDDITLIEPIDRLVQEVINNNLLLISGSHKTDNDNELEGGGDYTCFACSYSLMDKIGWFDPAFYPAYYEDIDMDRRLKLAECKTHKSQFLHYEEQNGIGSHTFMNSRGTPLEKTINDGYKHNKEYYIDKWGGDIGDEKYSTPFNG